MLYPVFREDPFWCFHFFCFMLTTDIATEIVRLFADDVIMYCPIKSVTDITYFRNDIERMENWVERWMMRVNVDKCRVMFVGRDKMFSIVTATIVFWTSRLFFE